tara:strand:+ start:441 stop:1262 length:822 start_codon:yes stop_codon:yes gene_type:complete
MSILLITDTQLGMALKNIKYGKWTKKALNWSNNLEPSEKEVKNLNKFLQFTNVHNPDFIIHTGDIVNEIDKPSDLSNYKSFLSNIKYKINHVPGNHDVGIDSDKLSIEGLNFYHKNFGDDFYNFQWKDFELFFLNSSIFINYENRDFYNDQINFIKQTLQSFSTSKRILIFMHHPPFIAKKDILSSHKELIYSKDLSYWIFEEKIKNEFFGLFKDHKLEYIFTGHLHINLETSYNETKIITTSALGLPLGDDPSGFRVIDYKDGKLSYDFYPV